MEITEKVAYLKGLMEGMKIDTETNEGKILSAMVDILEDIGLELEDLWNAQGELEDGLDVVSDDLEDIEDIVYDEDDEESFDDEYYEDDAEEDEDCYATTCPTCEETIYFDESVLEDGEVICPNCGEKLEFDMSSLEEDSERRSGVNPIRSNMKQLPGEYRGAVFLTDKTMNSPLAVRKGVRGKPKKGYTVGSGQTADTAYPLFGSLPRNRLASSATGGASPVSLRH